MPSPINKKTLENLAKLARIELEEREQEKLLANLRDILEHFNELQEVDTSNVAPMAGCTELVSIFREDGERENTDRGAGVEQFPEKHDGYLKIPPVFSAEGGSAPGGE
jgi:aspartyl-tRNA(Asn)/glutamyl-tRNA(Gln) amidotransferase subunit C